MVFSMKNMWTDEHIDLYKFIAAVIGGCASFILGLRHIVDKYFLYLHNGRKQVFTDIVKEEMEPLRDDITKMKENRIVDNERNLRDSQNMHTKLNTIIEEIRSQK